MVFVYHIFGHCVNSSFVLFKGKQSKEKKTYGGKVLKRKKKKNKSDFKKKSHSRKLKKRNEKLRPNKVRMKVDLLRATE